MVKRLLALLPTVAGAIVFAGLSTTPARAEDPPGLQVLFVLDVSGSMARKVDGSTESLMTGAKAALAQVSEKLPPEVALGLRVYGATYGGTDKSKSCADTQLVVPPALDSADAVIAAAAKLTPTGDTPIGGSLLAAAGDFAETGQKAIVLISDGEDTCHPPDPAPCQTAKAVHQQHADIRVDTIGLALGGQQRATSALRCIAKATGGSFYAADNAQGLAAALGQIAESTILRLAPGTEVTGAERPEDAPPVSSGAYRITLKPGQTEWFRIDAEEGQRPEVLATIQGKRGLKVPYYGRSCESWRIQLFNPYGEGGTYPPYGNENIFDGTGFAGVGAKGSKPISSTMDGIDFPGSWTFSLSLAAPTTDSVLHSTLKCADYLPLGQDFDVRFTLTLDPNAQPDLDSMTVGPSAAASPSPSEPTESGAAGDLISATPSTTSGIPDDGFVSPDLSTTKYDETTAEGSVDWATPVIAVLLVLLLGCAVMLARRWYRSRYF
ncbi:vWA domain-containing protein [Nocardioides sp.]|uniref:vWA domain-containing protein n=1 Tax=Nocardioides sp. TaxID=35761 RepID=UPI0039E2FE3E